MCSDCTIQIAADGVGKSYQIYDQPRDRLKQFLLPRLQRWCGVAPRKYFREFHSLTDVAFRIERGQTVGIVGKNGAGKSTLLQILCGTLSPTAGRVQVHGRVAALLELGAGFNPEFTGRDNVFMNAQLLGLTEAETAERFDSIVAFADIGEFLDQPVKTYSSGMFVRLAFAVIAHVDADVLVIDEALAVGDAYFTQKCMRFLRAFKERGTLLFVSHDASAVVSLCDRALWLDKGRLVGDGPAKEVMQSYLQELYAGQATAGAVDAHVIAADPPAQEIDTAPRVLALAPDVAAPALSAGRFGTGQAAVTAVSLTDSQAGTELAAVIGQEDVFLRVHVHTAVELKAPIVGFIVKDRLGQHLFGDNTFNRLAGVASLEGAAGGTLTAQFRFRMPILPKGEYSVAVAIADGTQLDHVVHEWVHEALIFQSHSDSVVTGLVGIPMLDVALRAHPPGTCQVQDAVVRQG